MKVDLHSDVGQRLSLLGQTYTPNRRAIVEALAASGPLTLPELLSQRADLAQSSAYRNLALLADVGVVRRIVHDVDHARFELAEELTGHHHHHVVCTGCGTVVDVELPDDVELLLDQALNDVARGAGFVLGRHELDLHGTCAACRG